MLDFHFGQKKKKCRYNFIKKVTWEAFKKFEKKTRENMWWANSINRQCNNIVTVGDHSSIFFEQLLFHSSSFPFCSRTVGIGDREWKGGAQLTLFQPRGADYANHITPPISRPSYSPALPCVEPHLEFPYGLLIAPRSISWARSLNMPKWCPHLLVGHFIRGIEIS